MQQLLYISNVNSPYINTVDWYVHGMTYKGESVPWSQREKLVCSHQLLIHLGKHHPLQLEIREVCSVQVLV